ncbi:MAG: hypothetical protein HYY92_03825 [Parcubacteria group bacterium]|nr:hypothetical protein [Parcubacteria group bacterium]
MRLLVSYFDSPRKRDIVKRLQEKGATIAYWLFIDDVSSETLVGLRKEFPETIFHGGFLLGAGEPAEGIDDKNFAPVDKDILFKLASYEGQILTMMKREDLDNTMPIFKKIYLYHKYVKYWHGVLTHYNIEAVLAMDIPHLSSWFVLYALCKILGIKCVMMRKTPADRYLFIDDVEDYRKLRERSEQYRGKEKKIEDLSPDMRAYYHRQITNSHNAPPFFMKRGFSRTGDFNWRTPGTRSLFAHIKHLTLPKAAYRYLVLYARFLFGLHYIGGLERRRYYGITLKIKAYQWHCMKMRLKERYYTLQHGADFSRRSGDKGR